MTATGFFIISFLITGIGSLSLVFYGVKHGRMLEFFAAVIMGILATAFFITGELNQTFPEFFWSIWNSISNFFTNFPDYWEKFIEEMQKLYESYFGQ